MRIRSGIHDLGSRFAAFLCLSLSLAFCGCAKTVGIRTLDIKVLIAGAFSQVYAGSAPITLTASLQNDPTSEGVVWTLSLANTSCSPGCGTLAKSTRDPKFSVVYTPPVAPPANQTVTITAASAVNHAAAFVFNFTITPAISVSITNKFSTVKSADPAVTLSATVSNDLSNAGVTWTLTAGGQPCPAASCGTLTAPQSPTLTATYTPPLTVPPGANDSPTITATSVTDPTKSDSFTFTIVQGIVVTITNPFSNINFSNPPVPVTVNATVIADPANAGVTWTLVNANGQPCANCGTLVASPAPSFSAIYTPPTTQPIGPDANPTITATSVTDPTKTSSFSFTITISTAAFAGNYALLLRGYADLSNSGQPSLPMSMAGSITLNQNSQVAGGDLDINNSGGITFASNLSGTFSADSSFNGINRLTINITNVTFTGATSPFPLSFKCVLSSDGSHGRILELDGASFVNVGTIVRQDPAALAAANPAGSYAFGLDSDSPLGGRTVETGQVILTSNSVSGGLVDESFASNPSPRYSAVPLTASTLTAPDSNGRGTLTLSVTGNGGTIPASADHYAYYIVNSGQINLLQIDQNPTFATLFAGVARLQNNLTASSVNAASVIQLTGMDVSPPAPGTPGPDVIIGVMTIPNPNGGTALTFTLTFDENDLGSIIGGKTTAGDITFDPKTGRGTIADVGGFGVSFVDAAVFYLYDVGQGFVIDADISTCVPGSPLPCPGGVPPNNYPITNNAFSGTLTLQNPPTPPPCGQPPCPPFGDQSVDGNITFAVGATANPNIPSVVAGMNFVFNATAIPPAVYTAKGDLSSLTVQDGNVPNVTFGKNYSVLDGFLGRGLVFLPEQILGVFPGSGQYDIAFFYLIGPNQFVAIGESPGANSAVMFFDPQ